MIQTCCIWRFVNCDAKTIETSLSEFLFWNFRRYSMANLFKILILIAISQLSSTVAGAENSTPRLTVYAEQSFPLSYSDPDANEGVAGTATEFVHAVLRESGIPYEISIAPWIRAIRELETKENVLLYSMARTESRENQYIWIGALIPLDYYLFGSADQVGFEDIKTQRIGVVRGDVVTNYLLTQGYSNLVFMNNPDNVLNLHRRGRIDLFPFSVPGAEAFISGQGLNFGDYRPVAKLDQLSTELYLVLSRLSDPNVEITLKQAYQKVVATGAFDGMLNPQ